MRYISAKYYGGGGTARGRCRSEEGGGGGSVINQRGVESEDRHRYEPEPEPSRAEPAAGDYFLEEGIAKFWGKYPDIN